ncbi:hypothetical protein P3W53_06970 [Pseudomonas denitrificans (nom. rej.)]|nr:hypothetical protein [Pseudomonas denitrificans (nom. rej.)]
MAQRFINNFSVETLSPFAVDEGYVLPLSGEAIAKLDGLLYGPDDYVILTVMGSDQGAWEIIRYQPLNDVLQFPILRGYEATAPTDWPVGSTISCNVTADTMMRLAESTRPTRAFDGQVLSLQNGSGVAWSPQDEYPYLELSLGVLSMGRGSPPVDIIIDLQVWDGAVATILRVPAGVPLRYPEGTTWERDSDSGAIILTLPPPASADGWYRLRLAGVNNLTLDISDYTGYVDTTET